MSTNKSQLVQSTQDQQMSVGIKKFLTTMTSLPLAGKTMTPAELAQIFEARVAATQAVQTASVARTAAVKANREKRAQTAPVVKAFTSVIQGMFALSPDTLAVFGLTPPKTSKKTAATKTAAALKSKATRKARSTMGKKQKAPIKGTVPAAELAVLQSAGASITGPIGIAAAPPTGWTPAPLATPGPIITALGATSLPVATTPAPAPIATKPAV